MPWAVAGGAIAAGGSLLGGMMQSGAAKDAQKQANWARQLAVQQAQQNYNTVYQGYQPYMQPGQAAEGAQANLLGLNGPDAAAAAMAQYQTSPGYQWQLDQGLRAVDAGAAARGMARSGADIKAEQTFGQGLANSDFGQYYNRLYQMSNQGMNAVGGVANAGTALTNTILGEASGMAQNAMTTGSQQASIYGNTASSLATDAAGLLQNKDVQSTLKGLFTSPAFDYSAGTTNAFGTSPGYGNQLFNPGGIF